MADQILRGRETPLTLADVRGLLRMLLLAVAHCHARGVAHRVRHTQPKCTNGHLE